VTERTLENILNDVQNNTRIAATELDAVHPDVRPGFEMAIREANENLARLRDEYRQRVFATSVGFFVTGEPEKVEAFASRARALANVFIVDAAQMYREIAADIEPTLGSSREFSVNQLARLSVSLQNIAKDAGLRGDLAPPPLRGIRTVQDHEAVVDYVHEIISAGVGEAINVVYATNHLLRQALTARFSGNVFAALVLNTTPDSQVALSQPFAVRTDVVIGPDDEVNEGFVLKVFENGKKNKMKKPLTKERT
jgi:hypothetical protein